MAEAVGLLDETIAEAEQIGNETILADALGHLGTLQMWLGDNEEAERLLRRSLEYRGRRREPSVQIGGDAVDRTS